MSKRNSVVFSKPEDPKFLKLFKQDSGYKEGPNVNTKVWTWFWYILLN